MREPSSSRNKNFRRLSAGIISRAFLAGGIYARYELARCIYIATDLLVVLAQGRPVRTR